MTTEPTLMIPDHAASESVSMSVFRNELGWLRQLLETRLDAMDRASIVLSENLNRLPTTLDREIGKVSALTNEKFAAMERLVAEREKQRDMITIAARDAVASALAAAKEAVNKAETSNEKRFDSVEQFRGTLSDQAARLMPRIEVDNRMLSMNEKIADLGARLDKNEGKGLGISAIWGIIIGVFGMLGVLATVLFNVLRLSASH